MQMPPRDHFLDNADMSESDADDEAVEDGMLVDAQPPLTPSLIPPAPATTPEPASEAAAGAGQGTHPGHALDLAVGVDVGLSGTMLPKAGQAVCDGEDGEVAGENGPVDGETGAANGEKGVGEGIPTAAATERPVNPEVTFTSQTTLAFTDTQ